MTERVFPKRKRVEPIARPIALTVELDGQTIEPGQPLVVDGEPGTFVFRYLWMPDSSLAVWGGTAGHAEMRNFRPDRCHIPKVKRRRRQMTEEQREANRAVLAQARQARQAKKVTA